jgi:cytochrome c oxidase subunit 4
MRAQTSAIWRKNGLAWLALLSLLGLTFGVAHLPLGIFNVVVGLAIASIKVTLVLVIFMGLGSSPSIIRLAAAAGLFWLAILFVLTLTDVLAGRQFQSAHSQTMGLEQSLDRNR